MIKKSLSHLCSKIVQLAIDSYISLLPLLTSLSTHKRVRFRFFFSLLFSFSFLLFCMSPYQGGGGGAGGSSIDRNAWSII
jgi:hypothetical protein